MRLLLDTHVLLWALVDDPRLSPRARGLIEDPEHEVWVSAVSLWEIAIKHALGRGDMPVDAPTALALCEEAGYSMLSIEPSHAVELSGLPVLHADPFDRMLIAQAFHEPMRLMTHDGQVAKYGNSIMAV